MHPLLKSIEAQKKGRDEWIKILLGVSLTGVALMAAIYPDQGPRIGSFFWLFVAACLMLGVSIILAVIRLFRLVAEPDLMTNIQSDPNILRDLERMRSDPSVKVAQTKDGKKLAFRMRLVTASYSGAILSFILWLVLLGIYLLVRISESGT